MPPSSNGGRRPNGRRPFTNRKKLKPKSKEPSFKGAEEGLEKYIFDKVTEQNRHENMYETSMEQLVNHVGRNFTQGEHIVGAVLHGEQGPEKPDPCQKNEDGSNDEEDMVRFNYAMKEYTREMKIYKSNLSKLYHLIIGQCTPALKANMKTHADWATTERKQNGLELLKILRETISSGGAGKNKVVAIFLQMRALFGKNLQGDKPLAEYLTYFKNQLVVLKDLGGDLCPTGLSDSISDMDADTEKLRAVMFLYCANAKYTGLITQLDNEEATSGEEKYPATIQAMYNAMEKWTPPHLPKKKPEDAHRSPPEEPLAVAFAQVNKVPNDVTGDPMPESSKCFKCGKQHYENQCPQNDTSGNQASQNVQSGTTKEDGGDQHLQAGMEDYGSDIDDFKLMFAMNSEPVTNGDEDAVLNLNNRGVKALRKKSKGGIPVYWLLLDSQSNVDAVSNRKLLRNIRKAEKMLRIFCNAGSTTTDLIGDLPGYGTVWYLPNGIANILSLANVTDNFRVTLDSSVDNAFRVHKTDGTVRRFEKASRGLYYYDMLHGSDARTPGVDEVDKTVEAGNGW